MTDAALRARALAAFPRLALWALRDARTPERLVDTLQGWVGALVELLSAPNGLEALRSLLRYIFLVADQTTLEKVSETVQRLPAPIQATGQTIAQWLEQRGREDGLREGKLHEARKAVRRVLAMRGLSTSAEQEARIDACDDLLVLEAWLDQAIVVATAADALR